MFKIGCTPNVAQVEQRPLHGTTVSIYGFHEVPLRKNWDIFVICFLIATIAVIESEVLFNFSVLFISYRIQFFKYNNLFVSTCY